MITPPPPTNDKSLAEIAGTIRQLSAVQQRALVKLARDMGECFVSELNDPRTVEILLNEDGTLWVEKLGESMRPFATLRAAQALAILETVAGFHGHEVTAEKPLLEAEFPLDGSRFAGQLPPVVRAPTFAIRKRAIAIFTLEQYVTGGIMTPEQYDSITDAVARHRNILVIGGTGSGKTTLVNAIINQMIVHSPQERVVIIEDTGEIQCAATNYVQYHTSLNVTMTALLRTTLRMRPDRILVGEVRGPEALDLLMAWNTGHEGGAATLHANNARAGLDRLKMLISMHSDAPADIEPLIAEAVHIVVHITRTPEGRRINEVIEVHGYANGNYSVSDIASSPISKESGCANSNQ
jgi:type IV secretion system protein VirB11